MSLSSRFDPFIKGAPVCVMVRATLEYAFSPEFLDAMFAKEAKLQYERELLFSSLVGLMCQVVCGVRSSICEAYNQNPEKLAVTLTSVYNKLQGVEDDVSAELVRGSVGRLKPVIERLGAPHPPLLPGYRTLVLDGNHLAGTEHRLKELRRTRSGPLPGQVLAVYDPQLELIVDVFPCQDGHAQERSVAPQVILRIQAGELHIADRNFCTTRIVFGIAGRGAFFLIRQHATTLVYKLLGRRRACGKAPNGRLYEQEIQLEDPLTGQKMIVRRVTLVRTKPMADGQYELHVLTNVPEKDASAGKVMELYSDRWTIERAFGELERELTSEINTLGYPKAALFGFCVALVAYNAMRTVKAALGAAHGRETVAEKVSGHYLATEVGSTHAGMMLAIPPSEWEVFQTMKPAIFARTMKDIAGQAELRRYPRSPRGPKKKRPPQTSGKKNHHVSTARLLARRKAVKSP
jgi:IS4 transposase